MEKLKKELQKDEQPSTSKINENLNDTNNEDLDDDDDNFFGSDGDKKKRKFRRQTTKLLPHLQGLMGAANISCARGDIETAKKMCFEIMRQQPEAFEPYELLAHIYESIDLTKYRGYLTIAGCVSNQNADIWRRLAELELLEGKKKQAIVCYSRAIRVDPKNIYFHEKRLELAEELGEEKLVLTCKRKLANNLHEKEYKRIIELCEQVAREYHKNNNHSKVIEALEIPFKRVKNNITEDLVNMMLESLLSNKNYMYCLELLIEHCNFTFEFDVDTNGIITKLISYKMPNDVEIDIKVKFIICLIRLKAIDLFPPLIDSIICEEKDESIGVESIGDLYLDIAEELMLSELFNEALKLLVPLVKSRNFSLAAVWLKYAECLKACNMHEQAVEAYFTVMTMAPQHIEVFYPLAMCLLKLNKKSEALDVLSQDLLTNKLDVGVLIERMKLLKQIGDLDDYWKCVELLLSRHCLIVKYPEEIRILTIGGYRFNEKLNKIKQFRNFRNDSSEICKNYVCIGELSIDDEYNLFKGILEFAVNSKQFYQFQKVAFMGLSSKKFTKHYRELVLYALFSCIYNNDVFHGYSLIREIVMRDSNNNLAWNLFNLLLQNSEDLRHNRFITRFQEKLPNTEALHIIDANYGLSVGNYNFAMKFFMKEFRKCKLPYLSFILGVMLLQNYQQRRTRDKKMLAEIITYLFMFYSNNRSEDAQNEAYYNLGRMYHQLGIMYLAEHYYLKTIKYENDLINKYPNILCLKQEAAYNLHLIYRNSGNLIAARNVLIKNIVV